VLPWIWQLLHADQVNMNISDAIFLSMRKDH